MTKPELEKENAELKLKLDNLTYHLKEILSIVMEGRDKEISERLESLEYKVRYLENKDD